MRTLVAIVCLGFNGIGRVNYMLQLESEAVRVRNKNNVQECWRVLESAESGRVFELITCIFQSFLPHLCDFLGGAAFNVTSTLSPNLPD